MNVEFLRTRKPGAVPAWINRRGMRTPIPQNKLAYAKVVSELLHNGPCTLQELQEYSGCGSQAVREFVRALWQEECCHVVAWDNDRNGANTVPVLAFGPGRDRRPNLKTRKEIAAAYRLRVKQRKQILERKAA